MMTYRERKIFVFDETLENVKREYDMPDQIKEGWGLTHFMNEDNEPILLVSDGSNNIYHVNPQDFSIQKTITVTDFKGKDLDQLNELELYKDRTVLANVEIKLVYVRSGIPTKWPSSILTQGSSSICTPSRG